MSLLDLFRSKKIKPGSICKRSGQYSYSAGRHRQATCVKGEVMPPPPRGEKGGFWKLTDSTRSK